MTNISRLRNHSYSLLLAFVFYLISTGPAFAQGTNFTYQGRLIDSGNPADGLFDMQFKLFDMVSGGAQQGPTITNSTVQVTNGVFTIELDFGALVFNGSPRFLEISLRPSGSPDPYTLLSPRQPFTSAPYAIRSVSSQNADTAVNAVMLGGVAASQYVQTTDTRLSDARNPLPGSASYIQNTNFLQPSASFNIDGKGTANIFSANVQFNIGNDRVLSNAAGNLFVGVNAGLSNASGGQNVFVGQNAGQNNNTGSANSFIGRDTGQANTTGSNNTYVGYRSGWFANASNSAFFGYLAGRDNAANENSFFGSRAGTNNNAGARNSFFGYSAGNANTSGFGNAFFGWNAGAGNLEGDGNSFFGNEAGLANTTSVQNSDSGNDNSFFGSYAGKSNTFGDGNSFFGTSAGYGNTTGDFNIAIGYQAGPFTTTGSNNIFIGRDAGVANQDGSNNTIIGAGADIDQPGFPFPQRQYATAIGAGAVVDSSNTIQLGRADGSDQVKVPGLLEIDSYDTGGSIDVCRAIDGFIATCSSSLRYKTDVQSFDAGLDIVRRLRPISFNWKDGGQRDVGFAAEEVEQIEPLLVTYNKQGQIEGVKYKQIATVLVNAVRELQAQIDSLKKIVCQDHPDRNFCKPSK